MEIKAYECLCDDALKIRITVFVDEQGFRDEFDDIDSRALHLVMYDGEMPIATCRCFYEDTPECWHIGRVAVLKEYRGKGLGKEVMEEAERLIKIRGGKICELSSQCRAQGFYESCGYEAEGEIYLDEGCPHIKMTKHI